MGSDVLLYGIETCDQVRKARAWLRAHDVPHTLHDFRSAGLTAELLARWMSHLPWDSLVNRRGTTWRQLDSNVRAAIVDQRSASEAILKWPLLIKRPVLELADRIVVGFSEPIYRSLFAQPPHHEP